MISKIKLTALEMLNTHQSTRYLLKLHKSFQEDSGSNKVAYITYYMFLSILPLLLLSLTIFDIIFTNNSSLRERLVESTFSSIPVVGPTLESNLSFVQSKGVTLFITVAILIWASRAGALALQDALNQIFKKDISKKSFLSKQLNAFVALVIISVGVVVPTFIQSIFESNFALDLVFLLLNIFWNSMAILLLFWVLVGKKKAIGNGPLVGGIGLSLIQLISVLFLRNSLDNQRPLYGTLAIVFVFIAWLSFQIRVLIYSAEINKLNLKG